MAPKYSRVLATSLLSSSLCVSGLIAWLIPGKVVNAQGQTFSSGSTGADGALNFSTPGSYYFDPSTVPNHHAGDTIFNFTTITIASGVTVRLDSEMIPGPVYWLATGAVEIDGTLDLSGKAGHAYTNNQSDRLPSVAGAGGYAGGVGGGASIPPSAGSGPLGGAASTAATAGGAGGGFSGSQYLIPLIGGSGGGGAFNGSVCGTTFGSGGGAGGGGVQIASSTSITVKANASITANGGATGGLTGGGGSCAGGGGAGGSIRLMATTIIASGCIVTATPGSSPNLGPPAAYGRIRLEAFSMSVSSNLGSSTPLSTSTPYQVALPATPPPAVKVISINGVPINANPFSFPDIQINTSASIPVVIQAQYVPVGTLPTIYIYSESGPDQTVTAPALQGTLQSSTSTVNIAYPTGGSRGFVKTSWTQ